MPSAPLELPRLHLRFKYRPRSQRIPATACAKLPARKTLKSGGSDPGFSAISRPKILPGRSRPMLVCGARAFLANARQPRSLPTEFQFWVKWASRYTFTLATLHHAAGVTACVSPRERVLSNKQCAAPHTTCPTRLHYERRRVLVTLKGTTQGH